MKKRAGDFVCGPVLVSCRVAGKNHENGAGGFMGLEGNDISVFKHKNYISPDNATEPHFSEKYPF